MAQIPVPVAKSSTRLGLEIGAMYKLLSSMMRNEWCCKSYLSVNRSRRVQPAHTEPGLFTVVIGKHIFCAKSAIVNIWGIQDGETHFQS